MAAANQTKPKRLRRYHTRIEWEWKYFKYAFVFLELKAGKNLTATTTTSKDGAACFSLCVRSNAHLTHSETIHLQRRIPFDFSFSLDFGNVSFFRSFIWRNFLILHKQIAGGNSSKQLAGWRAG